MPKNFIWIVNIPVVFSVKLKCSCLILHLSKTNLLVYQKIQDLQIPFQLLLSYMIHHFHLL